MSYVTGLFLVAGIMAVDPPAPSLPSASIPDQTPLLPINSPQKDETWAKIAGTRGTVVAWISFDCPMAKGYLPKLSRMALKYQSEGIKVIGLFPAESLPSHDQANRTRVLAQWNQKTKVLGVGFPLFVDSGGQMQEVLDARVTPEVFLLNRKGHAVYRGRIDDGYSARLEPRGRVDREDLALAVSALLDDKPVELAATRAYGCALARPISRKSSQPGIPDYERDVAPILRAHCQNCHQSGGLAPFPLTSYEEAVRWAEDIRDFTQARRMPPWLPSTSVPLRDCRLMSDAERATLATWVDGGCPKGDSPTRPTSPPPLPGPDNWVLGKPDMILDAGADLVVGAEGPDLFRCLVLPTGLKEGRYVTAFEVKPGNQAVVHHMVNFLDNQGRARKLQERHREPKNSPDSGPGYNFMTGPGFFPPTGDLGGWAPGSTPHRLSPGVGYWLPPNTDIVMQVHYHRTGKVEKDRSRLGLYFARPGEKITQPFQVIPVGAPFLTIPPNKSDFRVAGKLWLSEDCTLHMLMPHMHLLGKSIRLKITRPGQPEQLILDIPRWDYNWQEHYFLKEPMKLPKGTRLSVEADYDNTSANPRNPFNPPRTIFVGEGTNNEMCFGFYGLTRDSGGPVSFSLTPGGLSLRRLGELPK